MPSLLRDCLPSHLHLHRPTPYLQGLQAQGSTSQSSFWLNKAFQVSICPECREPYPEKAKRHRYAEKAAEELAELFEQRAQVLDN